MVQSVELVLDDVSDDQVRGEWAALIAADLPSQGRHAGGSNRPHITLGVASAISPAAEAELAEVLLPLHFRVQLQGLSVFTGRRSILVRSVAPSEELTALHSRIYRALRDCHGVPANLAPADWTPHVTLARGLSPDQVERAMSVVSPAADINALVAGLRRWDSDARRTWRIAQPEQTQGQRALVTGTDPGGHQGAHRARHVDHT